MPPGPKLTGYSKSNTNISDLKSYKNELLSLMSADMNITIVLPPLQYYSTAQRTQRQSTMRQDPPAGPPVPADSCSGKWARRAVPRAAVVVVLGIFSHE